MRFSKAQENKLTLCAVATSQQMKSHSSKEFMNPAWKELFIDVKSLRQRQIQQSVAASSDFHPILT
jgi:hypothetical protein